MQQHQWWFAVRVTLGFCAMLAVAAGVGGPIETEGGQVSGVPGKDPKVTIFRGIPYSAPPVGDLRWRAPARAQGWTGVRSATAFRAQCVGRDFGFLPPAGASEDCLYLNVWTAAGQAGDRLPVLVWTHGGGFQGGGGYHPSFEGENFAKQGVVVVTFNYRVSVFGFLAHPDLTAESGNGTSGTYGLLDQLAALTWVKKNIAAFGGDPSKVTVAGESAGAYSVSALTASPLAGGLFRAAIAGSGGYLSARPNAMHSLRESEKIGRDFVGSLGVASIANLRGTSAAELMKAVEAMADFQAFRPGIDGAFLTEPVHATYQKRKQVKVPILLGSNTDEGAFLIPPRRPLAEEFQARLNQTFGKNASMVRYVYPIDTPADLLRSELNLQGDESFNYPMWKWAVLHREAGLPVYYYLFGRTVPATAEQMYRGIPRSFIGALHGDEVPYAFGNLEKVAEMLARTGQKSRWEAVDHELSGAMLHYWVNFVKTGDPNGQGLPEWPRYEGVANDPLMRFDDYPRVRLDERISRMKALDLAVQAKPE